MPIAHRSARLMAGLGFLAGAAVGIGIIPGATVAQESLTAISLETAADFVAQPLTNSATRTPVVMLALSVDEQAFRRAYDDLSDLDGDGVIDTGYVNGIRYAGYFDPDLCYDYADSRYIASAAATDHRCSGAWSGNFMNWAAMTRIDLIRHALFGGLRSLDTATDTVLERAHVPEDSHAWVKIYRGSDLADYTPFAQSPNGAMSFCNVSRESVSDRRSQFSGAPPLLRVAPGAFPQWSSIEGRQCDGVTGTPRPGTPGATANPITDYIVRVEVCAAGNAQEAICRTYPNGSSKPAGVLQKYGESGEVRFGLVARSYSRPRSGGQLRRNAGLIALNGPDPAVCAPGDEILLGSGEFCPSSAAAGSIIQSLQRLRVSEFRYNGPTSPVDYADCDRGNQFTRAPGGDGIRRPGPTADAEGCNAYGNPVAELLGETLRYLAAAGGPAAGYVSSGDDERDFLPGLETPTWQDPLADIGECADCSIVLISNGPPSFDADELPTIGSGDGASDPAAFRNATDTIGIAEGLIGPVVIGRREETTPSSTDVSLDAAVCSTEAAAPPLSQVRGACPTQPARDGSFLSAGVAYLGHIRDLRPALPGRQTSRTYALEFASPIPVIAIPMPDGAHIAVTPSCQSLANNRLRQCSFTAAQPGPITASDGVVFGRPMSASGRSGSLYVAWDEAPYGQSQENNASALLSWCVGTECVTQDPAGSVENLCARTTASSAAACTAGALRSIADDELVIRIEQISGYISEPVRMGFAIEGADGTDANGTFNLLARPAVVGTPELRDRFRGAGLPLPADWTSAEVRVYRANATAARSLPSPLELAGKYGSFDAADGDDNPLPDASPSADDSCAPTSWDRVDNASGAPTPDCIPDSYHDLRHPGSIGERLERVLRDILNQSGEAEVLRVGVQSGIAQVPGAVFQTFYESEASDAMGRRATWLGNVQGLFVDSDGNFREDDASLDGLLDESDYSGHPVVQLFYDAATRQTRFRRFTADPADDPAAFTVVDDLRQLRTLWSARSRLASVGDVVSQRDYNASAAGGRHIISFADLNLDGRADAGETVAFTPENFAGGRSGLLNVGSAAQAATLINWTRGQDAPGLRPRQLDRDGSGARTQRLGDIVNSEPLVVGAPGEAYDLLYGDPSYAGFFRQYRSRRQVLYVGANDGMLHAFNVGYRVAGNGGFSTAPPQGTVTEHPLGSELWAYVPFNLLPHLGFLASPGYLHQWTMDGSPRAFDVRAFPADATHPDGWGTVLVVGMRLGGEPVTLPGVGASGPNRAAVADFAAGLGSRTELVTRSAYVLLDITDPEQPPQLIGEFTDPSGALGLTTSRPAVAPFVTPAIGGSPRSDAWYLVFGNGPDDHESATSTRNARLFALDLTALLAPGGTPAGALQTFAADGVSDGAVNFASASFVGDPVAVDWDLNYRADALYFGTGGGTPAIPTGRLFKLDFNPTDGVGGETSMPSAWRAPVVLLDPQRPVLAAPSLTQDERGNRWVLAGSGRLLSPADRGSVARQTLFGVIDRLPLGTVPSFESLIDTTAAVVAADGTVSGLAGIANEADLVTAVRGLPGGSGAGGWRFLLASGNADRGAERTVSRTALLDSILFASGYTPSEVLCADDGSSRLFGVNFLTGAARAARPALSRTIVVGGVDVVEPLNVIDLGRGLAGAPSLNVNGGPGTGRGRYRINVQTTTGAIQQRQAEDGGRIRSNEIDWRETHPSAAP